MGAIDPGNEDFIKTVHVKDAVGMALCHDITQIIPGEFKGRLFKKGHIIREEDVPKLLSVGKENIYVWDLKEGYVHENEAALRIAKAACGKDSNLSFTEPVEGKVEMVVETDGLLTVDKDLLYRINSIENIALATVHGNRAVKKGEHVAGTRIIPLVIEEEVMEELEERCSEKPILQVVPFAKYKVGLIVTGSEVYHGRIEDGFGPVVTRKIQELGIEIMEKTFVSDDVDVTSKTINRMIEDGAQMVLLTGGMSVDPDDLTPASIRQVGGKTIVYGLPVLPGAMFMLAYIGDVPVIGLPGCVMYHKASIFDLVIPRLLAGQEVSREDLLHLANGGFCLKCDPCRFPDCSFGKC